MMIDLNIPYTTNTQLLRNQLQLLATLGYTHAAINHTIQHSTSPSGFVNPIDLSLFKDIDIKVFTRVTIVVDEPAQGQSINKFVQLYDIVAVLPTSERALLMACSSMEVDIITFHYTKRLPTFLKHKTIGNAISRGIHLEIVYSALFAEPCQFMSNVLNVIRSSRQQNLIISSGASRLLYLRSMKDIYTVMEQLGLKRNSVTQCTKRSLRVLLNGRLRNHSYKQTVQIGEDVMGDVALKRSIDQVQHSSAFQAHLSSLKKMKR
ncbi:RPP1 [Cyberlindnera jadinii]|uniref:RPP1 protein n=1 Tax=Cyberlindnera jadinii (strain ATCC 18201 / CBS 1600 / BCRC 20928 / JCM 3617 / NBRC 0987 / NRRL Y-1542) TaxID=983966 RepID=A0A0H5C922_CYBJN|nr:RPP1 [Cyberlindnera jadinii]